MAFTICRVQTGKHKKDFLEVARVIYSADPNWICPPDKMVHNIFEPSVNTYFAHGSAERWILRDDKNRLAGRIAAFIDEDKKENTEIRAGGIGFFECVENQQAANLLFDTAKQWLEAHKVEAMDGPINFGENDRFWGLLVEGFSEPSFTSNYHLPYYKKLFENYGFRPFYEMTSNIIDLEKPVDERFEKIWKWIQQKSDVSFRHPGKDELEKFARYFREIYNDAWRFHEEYKPITEDRAMKFAKEIKFLFVSKMIPFAFVRDEPAGFLIATPDINQIFKKYRGRISPLRQLLFLLRSRNDFSWYRKKGILTRGHAIAIGIKPKFQQYGLEAGMMMSSIEEVKKMGFKSIELRWAGDFNPKIARLHSAVGAVQAHKHITYRYLFDPTREFHRYKPIPMSRGRSEQ